jgi:hypothetical protein
MYLAPYLSAAIHAPGVTGGASGFGELCVVSDLGNGEYEISYVPTAAGNCTVIIESGAQSRDVPVLVEAAEPKVASTEIDRRGLEGWCAGEAWLI